MKDFIKQAAHVKPDANQLRLNDNDVKRLNELGELIKTASGQILPRAKRSLLNRTTVAKHSVL